MNFQKIAAVSLLMLCWSVCTGRSADADTSYIASYGSRFAGKVFVNDDFLSIMRDFGNKEYTYKTNRPLQLGIGVEYKRYALSLSYGFNALKNPSKGKTESFDIQYSHYGRSFVVDIIAQSYKGFYMDAPAGSSYYRVFPSMRVCRLGLDYLHLFNSERFSYRAAFGNTERQLRSAGTWFVGGEVLAGMMTNGGDELFPGSNQRSMMVFLVGPLGGYAHNWIVWKRFYVNFSASLGADMIWTNREFNITPSTIVRLGMGYDCGSWAVFMNYRNNIVYPYISHSQRVGMSSGTISAGALVRI